MKFCMVTTFYPPYYFGGDAIYIYRLSNELAKRGHYVDVIHCYDAYRLFASDGKGKYPNHNNVQVFSLKSPGGFFSPLLTQQTGRPLLKRKVLRSMLGNNGYDVIHYHNMSLIGITTLKYGNAIKLYTTHEHWLICPMHVLWKFNREPCREKKCLHCTLAGKRPPQLWRYTNLLERMLENVDTFISPSRFTRRKHMDDGLNIPIVHIPYFLPKPEKTDDEGSSQDLMFGDRPYFLFVGRLEKIKGLQNIIPVFKRIRKYDLLIAGDGEFESKLKQMANGVTNIKFLGRKNHDELINLYKNAIALIVPSICYEVFGIIIIEAFSLKTPAIVNNLGAMPEVIEDSGGGFVYNTEEDLVNSIEILANNPDLRKELGLKGYAAFLKYWSEDSHMKRYLDLIEEIKQNRKNKQ